MRSRTTVGVLVLIVLATTTAGVAWWRSGPSTRLAAALELAPASTQRLSWTDWAGVRRRLGADLDERSEPEDVTGLLDRSFERGLSTTSALGGSAEAMHQRLGFSPATLDWELFAQGPEGAVEILGLPEESSYDRIGDLLEDAGFTRPQEGHAVWDAGPDVLARIDARLTPELQHVALLPDEGVILASDRRGFLEEAVSVATGDAGDLGALSGLDDVVEVSGEPLAAAIYDGAYTCEHLAMAQADAREEAEADALVAAAGRIDPVTGFAMGVGTGGEVRVAMTFADDDQARANADSRATLASGPAPGQGGAFRDRFEVAEVTAQGRTVVMDLIPEPGQYVLSDLSSGPVLFATC